MKRTDPTAAFTVSNTNSMTVTREEGYTGYVPANIPETTTNTYPGSIAIDDSWGSASTPGISALSLVSLTFGANGVGVGIPANVDSYAGGSLADQNFDDFIPRPPVPPMDTSDISGPIDPNWWNTIGAMASDGLRGFDYHASLDAIGLFPGAGELADGFNGILYTLEGDATNAGISFAGMVPIIGDAGKAGKYINKGAKHFASEALQETAEQATKHGGNVGKSITHSASSLNEKTVAEINRELSRTKGIPDHQIGPSGLPKIHKPQMPTRKSAQDAAQAASGKGGTLMHHPNPKVGNSHYHAVKPDGVKVRTHFEYPD